MSQTPQGRMAHDPFPAPHRRFRRPLASLLALAAFAAGALWATSDVYFGTWSLERPARPRVIETAGTMARVSWQPVTYSDHYEVAVSEGFRTVATIRVDTTEAQLPHLRPGTEYEVRVAAVDERAPKADVTSRRSEAATVRTLRRGSPALLEPTAVTVAEARNTSLSIGWEPVETARQYEVQLASDSRFLAPSTTRSSGRRAVLTGLDADMRYFVRVRAVGAGGATSDWTARLSARTILATDPLPL
ncbi:MAG TPA: fibronectin type III domain-containing protein, partial [Aeromicrobium sp.]|nr:fibronectin type III domain-containing protein [Aeromicrobium sp.]